MEPFRWFGFVVGVGIVVWTSASVIRTLVVPRGLPSLLPKTLARAAGRAFAFIARRFDDYETRDRILAFQAPTWLLAVLISWLTLYLIGFALALWPFLDSLDQALLESGSSIFTLGFAGTHSTGTTILHFMAAASGLVVVALQIGYLPTLYSSFNRRETSVTLLQSRAGAPAWGPELLWRYHNVGLLDALDDLYKEWERWAADVAESHTNYPVLLFFRSPHPLRSWILALLAILDSAAMVLSLSPTVAPVQARLCLRMGFLCLRDVAEFLGLAYDPDPLPTDPVQLREDEFAAAVERLRDVGFPLERTAEQAWPDFRGWRVNYESLAYAIADAVVAPPGPWSGPRSRLPGVEIVPRRPANRTPEDTLDAVPRGSGSGH